MKGWSGPDGEPTLEDVHEEFPAWRTFRGKRNRLCYATLEDPAGGGPPVTVEGEDPLDLRDSILRELYHQAEIVYLETGAWPDPLPSRPQEAAISEGG